MSERDTAKNLEDTNKCLSSLREVLTLKIDGVVGSLCSFRELVDARVGAIKEATAMALAAAKEAVLKAESANDKRFEGVNEFRNTLKDQQATLVTRTEIDVRFKSIEDKMALLVEQGVLVKGHSEGANWLWTVLVGLLGATGIIIGIINSLNHTTK